MKLASLAFVFILSVALTTPVSQEPALTPLPEPAPAPAFRLEDLQGHFHTLSDYRGQVLIVNFWATWCPPCIKELPSLEQAQERLRPHDVQVLAINVGESRTQVQRFMEQFPVDLTLLLDNNMEAASAWSVMGLPTTYVVDTKGNIVLQVLGDRQWDDPEMLRQILKLTNSS